MKPTSEVHWYPPQDRLAEAKTVACGAPITSSAWSTEPHEATCNRCVSKFHAPGRLKLGVAATGPTHYLSGYPVRSQTVLELALPNGSWLGVSYYWSGVKSEPARAFFDLWTGKRPMVCFTSCNLPPKAILRWPQGGP